MKTRIGIVKLAALLALTLGMVAPSMAEFDKRWYLGLGGGVSFIEPDPVDSGYVIDDDSSTGGKIFLGWDFKDRWGVELYAASLGEATLIEGENQVLTPPNGAVDYQAAGVSAVYHIYNTQGASGREDRLGVSLFGKLGGGLLDTDSDELTINQLEDYHLMLGLGVEYSFESGLSLRAEYEAFDTDAQLASVSLLWRFGADGSRSAATGPVIAATAAEAGASTSPTESDNANVVLIDETQPTDSDYDGVADVLDDCPGTASDIAVNNSGCPMFDKRLEGVTFHSGSANLTEGAKAALNQLAADLNSSPTVRIAIMAHTDNQGPAAGNLELSKKRAIAVAKYLVAQGIAAPRLRPEAYGESQPLVSNATADGRRQNRRVEFRALK